jgi:hypothetical protein
MRVSIRSGSPTPSQVHVRPCARRPARKLDGVRDTDPPCAQRICTLPPTVVRAIAGGSGVRVIRKALFLEGRDRLAMIGGLHQEYLLSILKRESAFKTHALRQGMK